MRNSNFFEISSVILFGQDEEDDVNQMLQSYANNKDCHQKKTFTKKNTVMLKEEDVNFLQKKESIKRYSMN